MPKTRQADTEHAGNETAETNVPKYTITELAEAAHLFGTSPDCVTAALRCAGSREYTKEQAQKLISDFIHSPVN